MKNYESKIDYNDNDQLNMKHDEMMNMTDHDMMRLTESRNNFDNDRK